MPNMETNARVLVAVLVMLVATSAWGAPVSSLDSAGKGKEDSVLAIKPGKLTGTVLYSDGKSPVAKAPVRIWSVDRGKFAYQGATDAQGAYEVPELAEGRYIAVFADRVRLDIVVGQTHAAASPLKVIVPRGRNQATPQQIATELVRVGPVHKEGAGGTSGGSLLSTSLIAIGGATAAVGVYELLDDDHHSSHHRRPVVSP